VLRLSLGELESWGEALGRGLRAPRVVTLGGDLGAGKTTLVQAICRGYGVTEPVTSPTFALVHEYRGGETSVYHLDLYRLRDARDLLQLGWEEIMAADALILVEWPERAGDALPPGALHLVLAHVAGATDVRDLHVDG
jgi:tRNA threonylcarbamoyladenosine biosynthesis protein TsaE